MILSMTGFGQAHFENERLVLIVEAKTLNSKYLDINLKLPKAFSTDKELEIRNKIKETLQRGKINLQIEYQSKLPQEPFVQIQEAIFKAHYQKISGLAQELGANAQDILRLSLQMPDVLQQDIRDESIGEEEWQQVSDVLNQALENCLQYRKNEGIALENKIKSYIEKISALLLKVIDHDPQRISQIKERIQNRLKEISANDMFDPNRFEQEMIYYIEKLDITEEKVRLKNHLDYFLETLASPDSNGKKLNFITQEIGREINTLGAKANNSDIQRFVVEMKEELEKIKEQILNIL